MLRDHGLDPGTGTDPSAVEQVGTGTGNGLSHGSGNGSGHGNDGARGDEAREEKEMGVDKTMLQGPEDLRDWSQSHLVRLFTQLLLSLTSRAAD